MGTDVISPCFVNKFDVSSVNREVKMSGLKNRFRVFHSPAGAIKEFLFSCGLETGINRLIGLIESLDFIFDTSQLKVGQSIPKLIIPRLVSPLGEMLRLTVTTPGFLVDCLTVSIANRFLLAYID